ncbi:Hypothetical protein MVR_LOCUS358 [uncultured virus]|nr:Hypothetical protein MVR_LOCUS358 [uncultured virus]
MLHIYDIMPQFLWDQVIAYLHLADTSKLFANVPKAQRHFNITITDKHSANQQLDRVSDFAASILILKGTVTTLQHLKAHHDSIAPRLTKLVANANNIGTIESLSRFARLQHLELSYCQLSTLEALRELRNLTHLSAPHNLISDVGFLVNMTKLKHLNLASNWLTTTEGFSDLAHLEHLDITCNRIKVLKLTCPSLATLLMKGRNTEWRETQIDCPSLQMLQVSWNNDNVAKLVSSCKLTTLITDVTQGSISSLAKVTTLTTLDLGYGYIRDITPLTNLTSLISLNLNNNRHINDLAALTNLTQLQSLRLGHNDLRTTDNMRALLSMTCLTRLNLDFNSVCRDHRFVSMLQQIQKNNPNLTDMTPTIATAQSLSTISSVIEIVLDLADTFRFAVDKHQRHMFREYTDHEIDPMTFMRRIDLANIKALVLAKINTVTDVEHGVVLLYRFDNVDDYKLKLLELDTIEVAKCSVINVLNGYFGYRVIKYERFG